MFSDTDEVKEYNTAASPRASQAIPSESIIAPKTIKRLEEISTERNIQRKKEEEEEEEDEDDEKLTIFNNSTPLKLDVLDIQNI